MSPLIWYPSILTQIILYVEDENNIGCLTCYTQHPIKFLYVGNKAPSGSPSFLVRSWKIQELNSGSHIWNNQLCVVSYYCPTSQGIHLWKMWKLILIPNQDIEWELYMPWGVIFRPAEFEMSAPTQCREEETWLEMLKIPPIPDFFKPENCYCGQGFGDFYTNYRPRLY